MMKNIASLFEDSYTPLKALVIYSAGDIKKGNVYVESYDMDSGGKPINAHPLSLKESAALAGALDVSESKLAYLKCRGLLPKNLLHYSLSKDNPYALWYTPKMKRHLHFVPGLQIPDGEGFVPPLLWKATKNKLQIWALKGIGKLTTDTMLYRAPFFNIYSDGTVCMGNVKIDAVRSSCLEAFMNYWENAFWNSSFSHLIGSEPIKGNLVTVWQKLIGTEKKFPLVRLLKTGTLLKKLLR